MEAIKVSKVITRPIQDLPELDGIVGSEVEIIVLVKSKIAGKSGPFPGAGRGRLELQPNWDAPLDDFKDYL